MLHAVREISKVTRNKLDLRHIHVKSTTVKFVSCCSLPVPYQEQQNYCIPQTATSQFRIRSSRTIASLRQQFPSSVSGAADLLHPSDSNLPVPYQEQQNYCIPQTATSQFLIRSSRTIASLRQQPPSSVSGAADLLHPSDSNLPTSSATFSYYFFFRIRKSFVLCGQTLSVLIATELTKHAVLLFSE
jgi:hypothetical protein